MQKLGKNAGGYFGEGIDIQGLLEETLPIAEKHGWEVERLQAAPDLVLYALRRSVEAGVKIYVSTGIHGDEPAGPLAICQLLRENSWPRGAGIWLCPCLNPTGFPLNRRENARNQDLNRDYLHLQTDEIRAHVAWLQAQPTFDLTLCLHEDWEANGFYIYELNPGQHPSLAPAMIAAAEKVCPIDRSSLIESWPAKEGIIAPELDPARRPQWPEAFYLITRKSRLSYTLEAPSDFPLGTRVAALVAATRAALETFSPDRVQSKSVA